MIGTTISINHDNEFKFSIEQARRITFFKGPIINDIILFEEGMGFEPSVTK